MIHTANQKSFTLNSYVSLVAHNASYSLDEQLEKAKRSFESLVKAIKEKSICLEKRGNLDMFLTNLGIQPQNITLLKDNTKDFKTVTTLFHQNTTLIFKGTFIYNHFRIVYEKPLSFLGDNRYIYLIFEENKKFVNQFRKLFLNKESKTLLETYEGKIIKKEEAFYIYIEREYKDSFNHTVATLVSAQDYTDEISQTLTHYKNFYFFFTLLFILSLLVAYLIYRKNSTEHVGNFDELTGVYNENGFYKVTDHIDRYSLLSFDIDHFKIISETYGKESETEAIQEFATLVNNSIRKNDVFARFDIDKFVMLLPNVDLKIAEIIAEKIRLIVEQNNFSHCGELTISIGIAQKLESETLEEVRRKANNALHYAKQAGRNCVKSDY